MMTKLLGGLALAGALAGAGCGHATPTGSARNNWATPTGHATATNPNYLDPYAGMRRAKNRAVFSMREAPTLQPTAPATPPPP